MLTAVSRRASLISPLTSFQIPVTALTRPFVHQYPMTGILLQTYELLLRRSGIMRYSCAFTHSLKGSQQYPLERPEVQHRWLSAPKTEFALVDGAAEAA